MVILIVEGDSLIGWALKMVLAIAGHHTLWPVATADEVLHLAQAENPSWRLSISTSQAIVTASTWRALTGELGTTCIFLTAEGIKR